MSAPAPKPALKAFKPRRTKVTVGPEEPLHEALAVDLTAVVPQPATPAPEAAGGQGQAQGPMMFGRRTVTEKAPKPQATQVKRPNVTQRLTRPKPLVVQEVVAAEAPQPEAPQPEAPKGNLLPRLNMPAALRANEPMEELATLQQSNPELLQLQEAITESLQTNPYTETEPQPYAPEDRKGFVRFIATRFATFQLPRQLNPVIDENACKTASQLQTYKYQAFVREYMRQASPYRGVLVYHGLGSGKTCTSIAASEALYSQDNKKIIIMTPAALKENFINEIMFCGFRHYRMQNVWVPFSLQDPAAKLFAETVVGIPPKLINSLMKRPEEQRVFWMPDLNKPESESNLDSLEDWQRSAVREQLYAVLQNKITFIGYTGFTQEALKEIATKNPTFFDDAVIIIDEVHNLTRLMTGKLEKYLTETKKSKAFKPSGKPASYEPVGVDTWEPALTSPDQAYERAFLFYRLLAQAKRSKIIALSGTPIVNQPTEFAILSNILHGYFHAARDNLMTTNDKEIQKAKEILRANPYVSFASIEKAKGKSTIFFTITDEGYVKVFEEGTNKLQGLMHVPKEELKVTTIKELYANVKAELEAAGLRMEGVEEFVALPLLPPTVQQFTDTFIDTVNLRVQNRHTLAKRLSGLVSYYRGSREELMPRVTKDEVVTCDMSALTLPQYTAARKKEIEAKPKKKSSAYNEAMELSEKESNSYRFRSRAICNFAFPTDLERPFPTKLRDLKDAMGVTKTILGDGATDIAEDAAVVEEAEAAEATAAAEDQREDAEEDAATDLGAEDAQALAAAADPAGGRAATAALVPYKERLEAALQSLRDRKDRLFSLDPSRPTSEQLRTYSSKFAEILERILSSVGSSLVYSTFKTVEGIGVFGMALEANGFTQIRLTGPETDLQFDEATRESFMTNPEQPRFILYSGDDSIRVRQTLINVFNCRMDKLPTKIAQVLRESGADATKNMQGQLCRAFMITGAGAEGLSLKNVRTVHIMEPYWNTVRTDQVKGRAVRICSHADLPYAERTVEVFTYTTVFAPGMEIDRTLILQDDSLTSDQYIISLAEAKEKVGQDMLGLIKSSAVDCILNQAENEADIRCLVVEGSIDDALYDPRLDKDIDMTEQQLQVEGSAATAGQAQATAAQAQPAKVKARAVRYGGVAYFLIQDPQSGKLIIYKVNDTLRQHPMGEVVRDETGKERLKFYEEPK